MRRPRHPPKLQHVLHAKDKNFQGAENKGKTACQTHDLVKAVPKDYGHVEVPDSSDYDYYDYTATGGANSSYSNMFQEEQLVDGRRVLAEEQEARHMDCLKTCQECP